MSHTQPTHRERNTDADTCPNVSASSVDIAPTLIGAPPPAPPGLTRSRLSLVDSKRVLEETEGIGRGVVGDLESQRETLLRSRTNVRETEGAAATARRLLRTMSRRELRHRLCLYLIIAALSASIVLVLYLKIRRRLS